MGSQETYLITASQIEAVFKMSDAVSAVEQGFRLYGENKVQMPPKVYLTFNRGDLRCMPVYLPTLGAAGVKNVNVHTGNSDLPTVMAVISLIDPETGFPLAIMDGTYLTALRTGAAGAVAARYLARGDTRTVGFVGAGRQAETQLDGLIVVRPGIRKVLAYDRNADTARRFCERCQEVYEIEAEPAESLEGMVGQSEILVTTTPAREPVVLEQWVWPGMHINAIGADAPGKQELEPAILKRARVVIDNWEQASHSGEINVALSRGVISRENIACDIGELVTRRQKGRTHPDDITVFDSTGLAVQDLVCAHAAYMRLTTGAKARARLATVSLF